MRSSTRYSMLCVLAALGGLFPSTCRHGARSIAGSWPGATPVYSRGSITLLSWQTAKALDAKPVPPLRLSTARASRRRKPAVRGVTTPARSQWAQAPRLGAGRALVLELHPASIQDRDGGGPLLCTSRALYPFVARVFADSGYNHEQVANATNIVVEIVRKFADQVGFVVLPRRCVVERFFAWINRNRRLAKDFEASIELGKGLPLRRLCHAPRSRIARQE